MPEVVHSTLTMFADDIQISPQVDSDEDREKVQFDQVKLKDWADVWQLRFNLDKYKNYAFGKEQS